LKNILTNIFLILFIFYSTIILKAEEDIKIPLQVRMIRAYGLDDERKPPIILLNNGGLTLTSPLGSTYITIEFDIKADVPPNLYAKFYHCSANWDENENVFLNDIVYSRTSNIQWYSAPITSNYYSYRGKIQVPNIQVKFKYSGNWKMKLFEYYNDSIPLAEVRFFVVEPKVKCEEKIYTDFYDPQFNIVSPSAVTLEAIVYASQDILDNQLNTVVFYRNHRWFEPYYVSNNNDYKLNSEKYKYFLPTMIGGYSTAGKIFRIGRLPAENEYRILNLTDMAAYPIVKQAVRKPLADYRRRGNYFELDDDGAMITTYVRDYNDFYVNMEFVLNPDNWISTDDVFVVGSFNNWKPDASWQMFYDSKNREYRLRHLIRRGRHNYLYATGRLNVTTGQVEKIAYDEFEGNTSSNTHSYIAFVYYRSFDYGGYDALYGVGIVSVGSNFQR